MRNITAFAERDPEALKLVNELPQLKGRPDEYRSCMHSIGLHLGRGILETLDRSSQSDICVVCTVEDADFLARGVIESLESAGLAKKVHLLCLWNERVKSKGVSLAPVIKQYKEEYDSNNAVFIVLKSIIAGACVVRTNLLRVLAEAEPKEIYVAAPVLLMGAEERLAKEFPAKIAQQFRFVHFVTDTETSEDGEEVIPGIGGSVYGLLGLGDSSTKNLYLPKIVKERRYRAFPAMA